MKSETKFVLKNTENNKNSEGFSLLEAMVAMVIFLIVTGAIFGLLQVGRVDKSRSSTRTDMLKNARVAVHLVGRDALNAGLGYHKVGGVVPDDFLSTRFGLPVDEDETKELMTSVLGGNNLLSNNLLSNSTDKTDIMVFAYRDVDFNNGDVIELASVTNPGGDPATPRVRTKLADGAKNSEPFDLYLLESSTSQIAVMATATNKTNEIDFKPLDPLRLNLPLNGTGKNSSLLRACTLVDDENCTNYSFASLKRFFLVSYKIKEDGTLVRIIYGNNRGKLATEQIVEQPLAYNVQDMQIKYLLENGTVTENPATGPDGILGNEDDDLSQFNQVRQITITLKVLSTEIDEMTRRPEVVTLSATYSTRNLEYDAG